VCSRVDGCGAMLQARRSWVRVLMRPMNILTLPNPSNCTMALEFTQPLTEMSTRKTFLGVKQG
jgi:hypothetical protein